MCNKRGFSFVWFETINPHRFVSSESDLKSWFCVRFQILDRDCLLWIIWTGLDKHFSSFFYFRFKPDLQPLPWTWARWNTEIFSLDLFEHKASDSTIKQFLNAEEIRTLNCIVNTDKSYSAEKGILVFDNRSKVLKLSGLEARYNKPYAYSIPWHFKMSYHPQIYH